MIKKREYSLLLIIVGLITYFAMTALFVGNSRYRLPVEIGFVVLALYGLLFLKDKKDKKDK
jgi:glucose uptake protein GlcU